MAAIARLHLLHPSPLPKPSAILSKFSRPSPFFNTNNDSNPRHNGGRSSSGGYRKLSTTSPLRSNSESSSSSTESSQSVVGDLLDYLNESWTQFHATAKRQLVAAGFHLLSENEEWKLKPGGRYFFTRNMSSLVAFAIGEKYSIGSGFHVIAAHTDSPCLKLKPKSASSKSGYLMVKVQTYGGGLWHTWFDRDLSLAGRVIVRADDGSFSHKLVKIKRPLLRVPTLAIHLDRTVNTDGFKPNLETHLIPLLAMQADKTSSEPDDKAIASSSEDAHHQLLMQILSDELGCKVQDIASIELNVCDTQSSCLGGANDEFIFSGRLDNLASSFCALRALVDACASPEGLADEHAILMVALFDNEEDNCFSYSFLLPSPFEELYLMSVRVSLRTGILLYCLVGMFPYGKQVGSDSYQGAGAPTMFEAMRRIIACLGQQSVGECGFARAIRHSFLVSADMAHGVHPNFADKHEENHRPVLQKGLVIKHNANQRYATSGVTSFLFKEVAKIHNLPIQHHTLLGLKVVIANSLTQILDVLVAYNPWPWPMAQAHYKAKLMTPRWFHWYHSEDFGLTLGLSVSWTLGKLCFSLSLSGQEFVVRNDMGCGSTIGPILASGVGIRTVDCGIPQLSMHSVREICAKDDVDIAYRHFKAFYKTFSSIDKKLNVDF
ncbi:hypothetical protein DH2020_030225 [Rehmannia glutinosa]|uniref:aspartyl aminopeptidase n=1 Tax=Rehmannia glutinosa TaxID=99300 RepID=A0ABR0VQG5_REHGL